MAAAQTKQTKKRAVDVIENVIISKVRWKY
jgi:hypothetical protein